MKSIRLLAVAIVLGTFVTGVLVAEVAQPPKSGKYWVYIGTYTSSGASKGIYRCELDAMSGQLTEPTLVAELTNPSFVTVSPNGEFLYAVGETSTDGATKDQGSVFGFRIDSRTGDLTKLNNMPTGGGGPCYVSVNRTGRYALVANYGGGSSAMFQLNADGSLGRRTFFYQQEGKGANSSRQSAPHAHCGMFHSDGTDEFAYVVDLGLDKVFSYKLNPATGDLAPTSPAFVKVPDGSGPRHISFNDPAGKAYVCGEMNSTLITLRRYGSGGRLEMYGSDGLAARTDAVLSTLPESIPSDVRAKNSTAEVLVHPSNEYVLVSNRGHNSLAVFKVNADSTTLVGHITSAGENVIRTPRNFNIDPTGKWILIASQDGNTVHVAEFSNGSGKVTGNKINVGKPVCIKFLAKP